MKAQNLWQNIKKVRNSSVYHPKTKFKKRTENPFKLTSYTSSSRIYFSLYSVLPKRLLFIAFLYFSTFFFNFCSICNFTLKKLWLSSVGYALFCVLRSFFPLLTFFLLDGKNCDKLAKLRGPKRDVFFGSDYCLLGRGSCFWVVFQHVKYTSFSFWNFV